MTTFHQLRNVGISAHIDSGKTTLTERMLFYCGRIHTIRDVRGGNGGATMDFDEIERKRGITIASAATCVNWDDHVINVIDTPGHVDFTVEVERSLRVLDGAVLVLCSVGGVQSQSLTVDRQMRRYGVPRIVFINKMDRTGANPDRVVDQLRRRLKTNAVALQIPIGSESSFAGVVDLITMQAVYFDGQSGERVRRSDIPVELQADTGRARAAMLDSLASLDDALMETVLAGEQPSAIELRRVVRKATIARQLTPVLLGSAYKNKGVQEVLDAITMYLPAPSEREVYANDHSSSDAKRQVPLSCDPQQPLVAMAFKTVVKQFGQLTFVRVYQGTIEKGRSYVNSRTGTPVRFGRLVRMHADQREEIQRAAAGDILGVIGIDCASGDTFVEKGCNLSLENMMVAEPVMWLSIAPANRDDADKLGKALDRFRREDPTLRVSTDVETGETLIAGMGQLHLDVYIERIKTDDGCDCIVGLPSVAYKERPTRSVEFEHKLKKMTGGPGQFAHIIGRLDVLADDSPVDESLVFEDDISGGRIDRQYISGVRQGFEDAMQRGPLGQYEVVGVKMTLKDGSQHEKDSSELAFRLCANQAMREKVLPASGLVLMEPIMKLDIEVPGEYQGAVAGHLARKRGVVISSEILDDICMIVAEAPLAELFQYANEIRSMTQGKGTFSMEPLTYQATPPRVQVSVLENRQRAS